MKRLNDEQRQFVAENHNLIYSFLNSNKLDIEEWYDLAAIGLCKAAINYNGEIAKFSTFAYKCMWNQVHIEMRKQYAIRRADDNAVLYYQTAITYEANDNVDKAISNHLKALAVNENFHPSYKKLGILFMARNDNESAIEYLQDYLNFDLPEEEKNTIKDLIARISN